jgi:PKD domain
VQPKTTTTVSFDASFSPKAGGLTYVWDFGDDTIAVGGPKISHTYSSPIYADVKLIVLDGDTAGGYRQAVPVGFDPAAAGSPPAPSTDSCGTLTTQEQAGAVQTARRAAATLAPGKVARKEELTG